MTYSQISKWLNAEGYKTPRGKRFSGNHVFSIFKKKRIRDKRILKETKSVLRNFELNFFRSAKFHLNGYVFQFRNVRFGPEIEH